jgi:DNA-binding NarL/FixJ family response regulator
MIVRQMRTCMDVKLLLIISVLLVEIYVKLNHNRYLIQHTYKYLSVTMSHVKILIVEDHPLIRAGIKTTIEDENDLIICGEASTCEQGKNEFTKTNPDFVIVDISLEESSGIDLIQWIRNQNSKIPVLVVSMHEEAYYIKQAFNAGAKGYLLKRESVQKITHAIRQIISGNIYASESVSTSIISDMLISDTQQGNDPKQVLSEQEYKIFVKLGSGLERKEIADQLHISPKTVESYIRRIKDKLQIENSTKLTYMATKHQE